MLIIAPHLLGYNLIYINTTESLHLKDTIENMKQEKKSFMPSGKGTMTVIFL